MPLVARRSPASEKAAIYGYGDLLRDSLALVKEKATANVERMTSGGMREEEIFETALAPAGGMLKVAGLGRLLPRVIKLEQAAQKSLNRYVDKPSLYRKEVADHARKLWLEALKIPEKEYGRIEDIGWSSMSKFPAKIKGLYDPPLKKIEIHPERADIETLWHEFTHARQFAPERGSRLPGGQLEMGASYCLRELLKSLATAAQKTGMSPREFYETASPIERHARGVASAAVKFPRDFSTLYKYGLRNELLLAKENLEILRRASK